MNRILIGISIGLTLALIMVMAIGCSINCQPCPLPKSESWDQENLKNHDVGCPTAIFIVNPKTHLLEQCT
jgi:hypothetical protein